MTTSWKDNVYSKYNKLVVEYNNLKSEYALLMAILSNVEYPKLEKEALNRDAKLRRAELVKLNDALLAYTQIMQFLEVSDKNESAEDTLH